MRYSYIISIAIQLAAVSARLVPRSAAFGNTTSNEFSSTVTIIPVWTAVVVDEPLTTFTRIIEPATATTGTTYADDIDVLISYTTTTTEFSTVPCTTSVPVYGAEIWPISTFSPLFASSLPPGVCGYPVTLGQLNPDSVTSTTTSPGLTSSAQITAIATTSPPNPLENLSDSIISSCLVTDLYETNEFPSFSSAPCTGSVTITRVFTVLNVAYQVYANGACYPTWPDLPSSVCATTTFTTIDWGDWEGPFTASAIPLGCGSSTTVLIGMAPSSSWWVPISAFPNIIPTPSQSCPGYVEPTHAVSTTTTSVSAAPSPPLSSTTPVQTTFPTSITAAGSPGLPQSSAQSTTVIAASSPSAPPAGTSNTAAPIPLSSPIQEPSSHDTPSSLPAASTQTTTVPPAPTPTASPVETSNTVVPPPPSSLAATSKTAAPAPPSASPQQPNTQNPAVQASTGASTPAQPADQAATTPFPTVPVAGTPAVSDMPSSASPNPESVPGSAGSVTFTTPYIPGQVSSPPSTSPAGVTAATTDLVTVSAGGSAISTLVVIGPQSSQGQNPSTVISLSGSASALPGTSPSIVPGSQNQGSSISYFSTVVVVSETSTKVISSVEVVAGTSTTVVSSVEVVEGVSTTVVVPVPVHGSATVTASPGTGSAGAGAGILTAGLPLGQGAPISFLSTVVVVAGMSTTVIMPVPASATVLPVPGATISSLTTVVVVAGTSTTIVLPVSVSVQGGPTATNAVTSLPGSDPSLPGTSISYLSTVVVVGSTSTTLVLPVPVPVAASTGAGVSVTETRAGVGAGKGTQIPPPRLVTTTISPTGTATAVITSVLTYAGGVERVWPWEGGLVAGVLFVVGLIV